MIILQIRTGGQCDNITGQCDNITVIIPSFILKEILFEN